MGPGGPESHLFQNTKKWTITLEIQMYPWGYQYKITLENGKVTSQ